MKNVRRDNAKRNAVLLRQERGSSDLRFEVVEIEAPEGSPDDLLDLVADLLVRKWLEGKTKGGKSDSQAGTAD